MDPQDATNRAVGFLEQAPGVRSSTRLFGLILVVLSALVTLTTCYYVLRVPNASAGVVGALAGILGALVANGVVAIMKRDVGRDKPTNCD